MGDRIVKSAHTGTAAAINQSGTETGLLGPGSLATKKYRLEPLISVTNESSVTKQALASFA